ncbi:unnamed protein product [Dicrocoelium dendriticum]|nr:unnamed protein product [Dicrocoelium dendriticum]
MLKTEDLSTTSDREGFDCLKATISAALSSDARMRVDSLVREVSSLKDIEKLLFCLLLPVDPSVTQHSFISVTAEDSELSGHGFELGTLGLGLFSPGGASALHLSNQVEQSQAYTWIMSHLEEDPSTCLRKDEVYDDYRAYCDKHHMKTLNTADFGKVMKRAFPNVKPRRLGQRGQSRYCYGGMRKKTEVQPPFLPDLTEEVLGLPTHCKLGHSAASPGSSSGASGDAIHQHRRPLSSSPLTRLLQSNGPEGESPSWADETAIRTALGVRGVVISDVAHILLEYAQQVFGVRFHSLFHLAQHLVTNRYVNARSRHAFSLIAHAANASSTPLSPPPSAALAEAIQKGISKSAFDRVGNGRLKTDGLERAAYGKADGASISGDLSRTPTHFPSTESGSPMRLTSSSSVSTSTGQLGTVSQSLLAPNVTRDFPSHPNPTVLSTCSTPQPVYRSYQPNFSPLSNQLHPSVGSNTYAAAAAALASHTSAHGAPSYAVQTGRTPSTTLRQSSAAVALAAAAAVAARQHVSLSGPYSTTGTTPGYSSSLSVCSASPVPFTSQFEVLTPPAAHKHKSSNFTSPSMSFSTPTDPVYPNVSTYLSPAPIGPVYAGQQPPAPLPPGVGARSPYTPIANPTTNISDSNQSVHKRNIPPHPTDAPGAYEPSPRFHLGGQSPNKRARYLSTASGSSGSNSISAECPTMASGSTECVEQYSDPSATIHASVASASPASSGGSGVSSHHPLSTTGYIGRSDQHHTLNIGDQRGTVTSPFYSSRYEGLEMRSPAPHHSTGSNHQLDRCVRSSNVAPRDPSPWSSNGVAVNGGSMSLAQPGGYNPSNNTVVFRPPVTPFIHELEDDEGLANLPRLGVSPGPQIPPSSPTEFLPFYSEAASKSAHAHRQISGSQSSKQMTTPDGVECGNVESVTSPQVSMRSDHSDIRCYTGPIVDLETPPSSALMLSSEGVCANGMVSPNSPSGSDNSRDRTLTSFDTYGVVHTPSIPGGLANVPSPSDNVNNDLLLLQREELRNELSTPVPINPFILKPEVSPASHTAPQDAR